ncbi:MAG: hypothetical protein JKX68_02125 [Flavobacteriales bacterium]|nr:hypothetical protein [Flavobacteriales bacterium]
MTFYGDNKVSYDATSKNSIFLVLNDDKIGVIDSETFSKAIENGDKEIKIKIFSNKDISIGELKGLL